MGVLFHGTEGLPFLWDGSDAYDVRLAAATTGQNAYAELAALTAERNASGVIVWLDAVDSPLHTSTPFRIFDRTVQALTGLWALINAIFAIRQLYAYVASYRAMSARARQHRRDSMVKPMCALCLMVLAEVTFITFLVDGPLLEHTHMSSIPWLPFRVIQTMTYSTQMLATLLLSLVFRHITGQVDRMMTTIETRPSTLALAKLQADEEAAAAAAAATPTTEEGLKSGAADGNRKTSLTASAVSTELSRGSGLRRSDLSASNASAGCRRSSLSASGLSNASNVSAAAAAAAAALRTSVRSTIATNERFKNGFVVAVVLLVLIDTAQSVLTGLYVMPGFLTMIMMAYVVLTMLSIGIWFLLQGQRLSAMLKRSAEISPAARERADRMSRLVRRVGACMVTFVSVLIVAEAARVGVCCDGWLYWTVLCPLWTLGLVARLLWSFFQIDAFKPSDAQATVSPCACLLKMKPPTRTAPPEASDGDPKIVADLSKKVATAYVVSKKSAKLSASGEFKKNKKSAKLAASFAESTGELSDGE